MDLKGRSAIITGANRGLGRAIAASFVQAGANVLLVARSQELLGAVQQELAPLVSQVGQRVEAMRGDVANPASCAAIVQQGLELLPDITILVNNAGVYGPMGLIEEIEQGCYGE